MSIAVVTGGAGFIGSHLSTKLADAGHEVRIIDNLSSNGSSERASALARNPNISIFNLDVRDFGSCADVCKGVTIMFHQAAEPSVNRSIKDPAYCIDVNVGGTVNMLRVASELGAKRFVFASTCAVYGDGDEPVKSEHTRVSPLSPYATSKLAGEHLCRNYFDLHGLETVALRYFNVYGPGQDPNGAYAAVIPQFLTRYLNGQSLVLYGDGSQSRDFIHIDDIVRANISAAFAEPSACGHAMNIASGISTTLNDLIEQLRRNECTAIDVERHEARAGDIKHSRADITLASTVMGFTPQVSLTIGLADTLNYYRRHGSRD